MRFLLVAMQACRRLELLSTSKMLSQVPTVRRCWVAHCQHCMQEAWTGLSRAGSMMSGLLVAATRYTPARPSMPSISVSSWFTTLHRWPVILSLGAVES